MSKLLDEVRGMLRRSSLCDENREILRAMDQAYYSVSQKRHPVGMGKPEAEEFLTWPI